MWVLHQQPLVALGAVPDGFFRTDADNNDVPTDFAALQALNLAHEQAMVAQSFAIHQCQRAMKEALPAMTDAQLIYAPRYPALPWAWGSATVNVQMPAAIITTDSLEPDPRPAYNAVYVGGMAQGVLGQVRRIGTAGDLLAPQVTDALITQEVAARQRGSAVLGGAGNKLTHTMTLPLLTGGTNPGLIQPGYLIEVNDIGHTWRGLVRGIRITAGIPIVRQTITVERNA